MEKVESLVKMQTMVKMDSVVKIQIKDQVVKVVPQEQRFDFPIIQLKIILVVLLTHQIP